MEVARPLVAAPVSSWRTASARLAGWRYPVTAEGRDLRLDLLRGLCIAKMLFSHVWWTPLHAVNGWVGFITAAEGFFLISGYTAGMVYRRLLARDGWRAVQGRLAWRAAALYVANLGLLALHFSLEAAGAVPGRYLWRPGWRWIDLLSFDQPYFLALLPRYSAFLLLVPLALWLLARGRTPVLLGVSLGIYVGQLVAGGWLVPLVEPHGVGMSMAAWQVLFFGGLAAGYHHQRLGAGQRWMPQSAAVAAAGVLCTIGVVLARSGPIGPLAGMTGESWTLWFGRELLGPARVLNNVAAFVLFYFVADRLWGPVQRGLGRFVLPLGQRALAAFLLHIFVITLVNVLVVGPNPSLLSHVSSVLLLDVVVVYAVWRLTSHPRLAAVVPG